MPVPAAAGARADCGGTLGKIMAELVTILIDGKPIEVEKGTLVIEAARRLGTMIPHFC